MTDRPDIPEEAIELLAVRLNEHINPNSKWVDLIAEENSCVDVIRAIAVGHLQVAAPALRKQGAEEEREWLREALAGEDAVLAFNAVLHGRGLSIHHGYEDTVAALQAAHKAALDTPSEPEE